MAIGFKIGGTNIGFKAPKGFKIGGQLGGILQTGGDILKAGGEAVDYIGGEIDRTGPEKRAKEKRAKKRRDTVRAAAAAKAKTAEELETRRKPLRLGGQRTTRISKGTPELFATSAGQTKTLLG